jgi:hypothetical protein
MRGYCKLKQEALDRTVWRTRFGRCFELVVKSDYEMNVRWCWMLLEFNVSPTGDFVRATSNWWFCQSHIQLEILSEPHPTGDFVRATSNWWFCQSHIQLEILSEPHPTGDFVRATSNWWFCQSHILLVILSEPQRQYDSLQIWGNIWTPNASFHFGMILMHWARKGGRGRSLYLGSGCWEILSHLDENEALHHPL